MPRSWRPMSCRTEPVAMPRQWAPTAGAIGQNAPSVVGGRWGGTPRAAIGRWYVPQCAIGRYQAAEPRSF